MCTAAKAGERARPTARTGNGKRRALGKSNRLQEVNLRVINGNDRPTTETGNEKEGL